MYYATNCVVCGSGELNRYPAVVAPFIAIYALQTKPFLCDLCECRHCSVRFFDLRLDEKEMSRLYSGYRGEEYFRVRHKYEFRYTKKINDGIGADPSEIISRQEAFQQLLRKHIDVARIRSVLDFGEDRG